MLGRLGDMIIGTNHLTGPTEDREDLSARFAKHKPTRGKPVLQDLGDDADTKSLSFFFDEMFCNPEEELERLKRARTARLPLELFFDLIGFQVSTYIIEHLEITRLQESVSGRLTRVEVKAKLTERSVGVGNVIGRAVGAARAIASPLVRRF